MFEDLPANLNYIKLGVETQWAIECEESMRAREARERELRELEQPDRRLRDHTMQEPREEQALTQVGMRSAPLP